MACHPCRQAAYPTGSASSASRSSVVSGSNHSSSTNVNRALHTTQCPARLTAFQACTLLGLQEKHATIGVASLQIVTDSTGASRISSCLEAAVPLLKQSHGTLVSLLGEHLVTGWNLTQPVPLHAENAVQFVRRVLRVPLCEGLTAGLASGTVYHGDVGTRSQRFLTVAGPALTTSLHVWRTARDAGQRFLYTPGEGAAVGAVQDVLVESTLVLQNTAAFPGTTLYELRQEQRAGYSKVQLG